MLRLRLLLLLLLLTTTTTTTTIFVFCLIGIFFHRNTPGWAGSRKGLPMKNLCRLPVRDVYRRDVQPTASQHRRNTLQQMYSFTTAKSKAYVFTFSWLQSVFRLHRHLLDSVLSVSDTGFERSERCGICRESSGTEWRRGEMKAAASV